MAHLTRGEKILALLFVLAVFVATLRPLGESDAFYHLKTGQIIWETRSIPQADIFSYTAEGRKWVPHEWLAQVVFYLIYLAGGYWGLIFFIAVLAALTHWLIFYIAVRRGADVWLSLVPLSAAAWLAGPYWQPRPQIFSYIFLTLLFLFLSREGRIARYGVWATIFLWANMHGGVVLGLGMVLVYAVLRAIVAPGEWRTWTIFAVGAGVVALVNPAGYDVLIYAAYVYPALKILPIYEWRSLLVHLGGVRENVAFIGLMFSLAVALRSLFRRSYSFPVLATLVFALLPLIAIRHVALWATAGMIPLLYLLKEPLRELALRFRYSVPAAVLAILLLAITGLFALPSEAVHAGRLPVHASNFIEKEGIKGPRFNLYNEGGYLIWRFWPKDKVFVDGRSEVFAGRPLSELVAIVTDHPEWKRLVDEKYRINHFLLAYRSASLARSIRPVVERLQAEGWILVFWDDAAVIFLRNVPENEKVIAAYGLRHVSPFRDPKTISREEAQAAGRELERLLEIAPHAETIRSYAAEFLSLVK